MKAFYRKTIALCISLAILFITIGSAAAEVSAVETGGPVEIRGPVSSGPTPLIVDATHFAALDYNVIIETPQAAAIGESVTETLQ